MPKDTPSMAKNKIRRSLVAIIDPPPSRSKINELWRYFEFCCAYCGKHIERESRTGHIDHLIPVSQGGSNNIHNHVLSCARCNGDEKREESWSSFLSAKCSCASEHGKRKKKIEQWLAIAPNLSVNQDQAEKTELIINEAISKFEDAVEEMRALRDKIT